ncbi:MAG: hypothetical protein QHI48_07280 [Bacteroidota bacterium]|nr:hypothetical protein [Bacteroidota bacterium]
MFNSVILLTKNPSLLLSEYNCNTDGFESKGQGYLESLLAMKEKVRIEISIAFYNDDKYKEIEPGAPSPKDRIAALRRLIDEYGFKVRLRLDPIFPHASGIQTRDEICRILDESVKTEFIISKPLRLPKKVNQEFLNRLMPFYSGGKNEGVEWHSTRWVYSHERKIKEMAFLRDECQKRGMLLVDCKSTVLVDKRGEPILKRILERGISDFEA